MAPNDPHAKRCGRCGDALSWKPSLDPGCLDDAGRDTNVRVECHNRNCLNFALAPTMTEAYAKAAETLPRG